MIIFMIGITIGLMIVSSLFCNIILILEIGIFALIASVIAIIIAGTIVNKLFHSILLKVSPLIPNGLKRSCRRGVLACTKFLIKLCEVLDISWPVVNKQKIV